jgi:hypothetical protein
MNNSLLLAFLVTLFSSSVYSKEASFKWSGVVPLIQTKINSPVIIDNENIQEEIDNKSWLIEDTKQNGKYDNEYGVVKILTITM